MNYIMLVIISLLAIIVVYYLITYNKFIKLNNNFEEAFSTMDVYKKKMGLIPNIVETVKRYAKHEKHTLKEIVEMRNAVSYDNLLESDKISKNVNEIFVK